MVIRVEYQWYLGRLERPLPRVMFQIRSLRNFLEIVNSLMRSFCRLDNRTCFKPHILIPFMDPSMEVVKDTRLSIASSHMAWRETTRNMVIMEPTRVTIQSSQGLDVVGLQNKGSFTY